MKKMKLKIYTSFVSPKTLDYLVKNNYLPIFIIRYIGKSDLIGKYSGTAVHMPELSPSSILYQKKRDGILTVPEFNSLYLEEINKVDIEKILKKLELMASLCNAKGVVLMGYGSDYTKCHRKPLAEFLDLLQRIESPVKEFDYGEGE